MQVTIEFYGRLKAQFNDTPINFETNDETIEKIYLSLCQQHHVEPNQRVIKPILNDQFTEWHTSVKPNDVIGFFPPAAGG